MLTKPTPSPMKSVIDEILTQHQLKETFESASDFHLRLDNEPYMQLVIERHDNELSVAHYYTENGDAMRDPELTFDLETWQPTSITQDPLGHYACLEDVPEGPRRTHLANDLKSFAATWARNLSMQGFTGKTVKASSLTHQASLDEPNQPAVVGLPQMAPDEHLEMMYEDQSSGNYEPYEPSPYDGTYSED